MRRYCPSLLTETEGQGALELPALGPRAFEATTTTVLLSRHTTDISSRLLGHFLIWAMPDEGMEESLETLADILRFHQEAQELELPKALPMPLPTEPARLKVGSKYDRPPLDLSE